MDAKSEPKAEDQNRSGTGGSPSPPRLLEGKTDSRFRRSHFCLTEGKGTSALTGRRVSMARLAETLSETIGTFVVDKTGMAGNYYFAFKFLSEINAPDADTPTIFDALQEQLGLKLEKEKGPVEIVIVDAFDAPNAMRSASRHKQSPSRTNDAA